MILRHCVGLGAWTWACAGAGRNHRLELPTFAGAARFVRCQPGGVNHYLEDRGIGIRIGTGTISDAALVSSRPLIRRPTPSILCWTISPATPAKPSWTALG